MSAKALQLTAAHVQPRRGPAHSAFTNTPGFVITKPVASPEPLTALQVLMRRCESGEPGPLDRPLESDNLRFDD